MIRIVVVTYIDGRKMYRAQTNRILGIIPIPWTTIAAFDNFADAKKFCGYFEEIIKKGIKWESKNKY